MRVKVYIWHEHLAQRSLQKVRNCIAVQGSVQTNWSTQCQEACRVPRAFSRAQGKVLSISCSGAKLHISSVLSSLCSQVHRLTSLSWRTEHTARKYQQSILCHCIGVCFANIVQGPRMLQAASVKSRLLALTIFALENTWCSHTDPVVTTQYHAALAMKADQPHRPILGSLGALLTVQDLRIAKFCFLLSCCQRYCSHCGDV